MKKLFYTLELGGSYIDDFFEGDGNRVASVYEIRDNKPIHITDVEMEVCDNSIKMITDYLIEELDFEDNFNLEQL